jgi:VanZ family protein
MTFQDGKPFAFCPTTQATLLKVLCASVLCGILIAGLWPFHAPKNEISWLSHGNGLLVGRCGSFLSAGAFKTSNSKDGVSLEIWLQPSAIGDSGTILSFYPPEGHATSFALRQAWGGLALLRNNLGEKRSAKVATFYTDHVFGPGKPVFLTISSGGRGTSIFVNGVQARMSRDFRILNEDLAGQLIIGNSSVTTYPWSGQLKGLAIYNRELTAGQVTQHYQSWVGSGKPGVSVPDGVVALYIFNEGSGHAVHNQADSETDLLIPERFFVLHEAFLKRPWNEYYPGWRYWKDIGINIAGFIPLGFVFYAYFSLVQGFDRPAAVTIGFGLAVSLTIEVLQGFLPTRNSGTTDLITNTLGTGIGVMVYKHKAVQTLLARVALYTPNAAESVTAEPDVRATARHSVRESKEMYTV